VIKINVFGADPAPQQKLPGLGLDTTSGSASGKTLRKATWRRILSRHWARWGTPRVNF
jgi:hypothetical protein